MNWAEPSELGFALYVKYYEKRRTAVTHLVNKTDKKRVTNVMLIRMTVRERFSPLPAVLLCTY